MSSHHFHIERSSTDRRRSRSCSASTSVTTSVTRQTGRSVTPSQGSRRSVTPTRRGRVGPGPLGGLGEETLHKMEALEEYTLDSFDLPSRPARRLWYASPVMTVTIWRATCHGHPGWSMQSSSRWPAADDATSLKKSTQEAG